MARRCGKITLLKMIIIFVIILATLGVTAGELGKKLADGLRGMNVPIPGTECPGDVDDAVGAVSIDDFKKYLRDATAVAWNGQKRCWIRQTLDTGTITQGEMYEIMKEAMDTWNEKEYDDCLNGYFTPDSTTTVTGIDMVIWWDNKAVCGTDGLQALRSWGQGVKGMSRDTLHFYKRKDYCKAKEEEDKIDWYNPPGNSNIYKYSESKAKRNDGTVCFDESDSGGDNLRLPDVCDWTDKSVPEIKNSLESELSTCVTQYKSKYNDGETGGADIYLACKEKYKIKNVSDTLVTAIVSDGETYGGDEFNYTSYACDILDYPSETIPDYSEFSSTTWTRSSKFSHCIYILLDGFVQTAYDLESAELEGGKEYIITPFFYFEDGANDIIIEIMSD